MRAGRQAGPSIEEAHGSTGACVVRTAPTTASRSSLRFADDDEVDSKVRRPAQRKGRRVAGLWSFRTMGGVNQADRAASSAQPPIPGGSHRQTASAGLGRAPPAESRPAPRPAASAHDARRDRRIPPRAPCQPATAARHARSSATRPDRQRCLRQAMPCSSPATLPLEGRRAEATIQRRQQLHKRRELARLHAVPRRTIGSCRSPLVVLPGGLRRNGGSPSGGRKFRRRLFRRFL